MNPRLLFAIALVVSLSGTHHASAAFTPILDSPDQHNEPNLIGVNPYPANPNPSILETVYGEANLRRVDDLLDHAFRHTGDTAAVKAIARYNNPSLDDTLRAYNIETGLARSVLAFRRVTPAGGFPVGYDPPTQFNFPILLADSGEVFELGLHATVRSNPGRNPGGQDMMVTFEIVDNAGHPENAIGNYVVGWEAFAVDDLDYQDLVFEISGVVPVPEPACAAMLIASLSIGCLGRWRRASGQV